MQTAILIKPKIAFVGVGWIGRHRMQAVANTGLAEIVGFSDPSEECIDEAIKIAHTGKRFASLEEILNDPDIDAVVIATPSAVHMEQAVAAFRTKKSVFCQKPLGRNSHEVLSVINAAKDADKLLSADFSYRYTAAYRAILQIIQSGELGELFAAELKFHNAYGPGKPWFYDIQLAGGGCVLDLGVHMIDLMLNAFGYCNVQEVTSRMYTKGKLMTSRTSVEDYADVVMQLENNVNAHLSCSWNLQAGTEAIIEASFYGTNGGVAIKNINGSFYNFSAYRYNGTKSEIIAEPPDEWGGRAIEEWVERLTMSDKFNEDAFRYLPSSQVIDRIYEIE